MLIMAFLLDAKNSPKARLHGFSQNHPAILVGAAPSRTASADRRVFG
jgi:hypothetical protein